MKTRISEQLESARENFIRSDAGKIILEDWKHERDELCRSIVDTPQDRLPEIKYKVEMLNEIIDSFDPQNIQKSRILRNQ